MGGQPERRSARVRQGIRDPRPGIAEPGGVGGVENLRATVVPAETVLTGVVPDQAALYGVLNRLQALGLDLVEVRRVREDPAG